MKKKSFMRKVSILLIILTASIFLGCVEDDDNISFFYELVPVESVDIPEAFVTGKTYKIKTSFFRPTTCHTFSGYDYRRSENKRTVSVVNIVFNERACDTLPKNDTTTVSFDFIAGREKSYIFEFWQGEDAAGKNQFLTVEVPVVQEEPN
ncbi:hypothetical protein ACFSTE_06265 [Aquimarina hainanensis]|uniref:Lipoprotein n=1 Tax=Aquimarina hainanensis TaxID=1578017 RepID=A0ABW5N7B2_9FLAO